MVISFIVIAQQHFPHNRAMASNIIWAGSSVGQIIAPMMIYFLIQLYGWRWCMRIQAALLLNAVVLAWLMFTPTNLPKPPNQSSALQKLQDNFMGMLLLFTHDVNFIMNFISNLLSSFLTYTVLVHTGTRALSLGIEPQWAAFLFSLESVCTLGTR